VADVQKIQPRMKHDGTRIKKTRMANSTGRQRISSVFLLNGQKCTRSKPGVLRLPVEFAILEKNRSELWENAWRLTLPELSVSSVFHPWLTSGTERHGPAAQGDTSRSLGRPMKSIGYWDHGLLEKCNQRAMQVELELRGLVAELESKIKVMFQGKIVGDYQADLW